MDVAFSWLLLLALALFIYGPWQTFWEDWGRQRLFEIRDNLFDLAADGLIKFDDEEYKTIRNSYNSAIRFMHELTWPRLLYLAAVHRINGASPRISDIEAAISNMPESYIKENLKSGMEAAGRIMFIVIVGRSPILLSMAAIVYIIATALDAVLNFGLKALEEAAFLCSFQIVQRDAEMARPMIVSTAVSR